MPATRHPIDRRTVTEVTIQHTANDPDHTWWLELQIGNRRALFTQEQAIGFALALEKYLPKRKDWTTRAAAARRRRAAK